MSWGESTLLLDDIIFCTPPRLRMCFSRAEMPPVAHESDRFRAVTTKSALVSTGCCVL